MSINSCNSGSLQHYFHNSAADHALIFCLISRHIHRTDLKIRCIHTHHDERFLYDLTLNAPAADRIHGCSVFQNEPSSCPRCGVQSPCANNCRQNFLLNPGIFSSVSVSKNTGKHFIRIAACFSAALITPGVLYLYDFSHNGYSNLLWCLRPDLQSDRRVDSV